MTCVDPEWLCWIEAHDGLAGWFQAVFSVLAILSAIAVPMLLAARDAARQRLRLHNAAYLASTSAAKALNVLAACMREPASNGRHRLGPMPPGALDSCIARLEALPIHSFEDLLLAENIGALLLTLRHAVDGMETTLALDDSEIEPRRVEAFDRMAERGRSQSDAVIALCTSLPRKVRQGARRT